MDGLANYVASHVMEALDDVTEDRERPCFVAAALDVPPDDCHAVQLAVMKAVDDHIESWGLRQPLITQPTSWRPNTVKCVMNMELDAALVEGRWDKSSLLVLDDLVDEELRSSLLALLHGPGWDPESGADPGHWCRGSFSDTLEQDGTGGADNVRGTGLGLSEEALEDLCAEPPEGAVPAPIVELQTRVAAVLEEANVGGVEVCRMPASCLGDCVTPLAANAPLASDGDECFGWHIDADPYLLPPSPWVGQACAHAHVHMRSQ